MTRGASRLTLSDCCLLHGMHALTSQAKRSSMRLLLIATVVWTFCFSGTHAADHALNAVDAAEDVVLNVSIETECKLPGECPVATMMFTKTLSTGQLYKAPQSSGRRRSLT